MNLSDVEASLAQAGLSSRGAFHPVARDGVPLFAPGVAARTVVLAGNAGPRMWRRFAGVRAARGISLDAWSETVLNGLAEQLGAAAAYPFKRPYLPFQRWARRAQACHGSPLGLLIHPDYGVWHGYRGALLFAQELKLPEPDRRPSPCASCAERPCMSACPVGAFSDMRYDVPACARYLAATPEPACMEIGCLARHACPVGRDYRYAPEQARFHMLSFRRNHQPGAAAAQNQGAKRPV